jgi:hypothetical protein
MAQAETGSAPFFLPVRIRGQPGMAESSRRKSSQRKSSRNLEDNRTNDPKLSHPSQSSKGGSPSARGHSNSTRRPNTKQTGERSEAAFLHRASALGFGVAKPWGDSLRYDFILDNGERLWRIQIKCTESIRAQAYETRATYTIGKTRAVYTTHDTDFIAAHIVPLDIWYILPVEVCTPAPMLRFYPHRQAKKMRLEKYRELWTQLKPESPGPHGPITIQAVADETIYPDLDSPCSSPISVILSEAKDPCNLPAAIP